MGRNVLLLILDCVRKDTFDQYAPRLQELADVEFEQARAASSWSPPSHAAIFSGQMPSDVGIHNYQRSFAELSDRPSIFSDLDDYQHLAVNANPAIGADPAFEMDVLFDEYEEPIVLIGGNRYPEGIDLNEFLSERGSESPGPRDYLAFLGATLRHEHALKSGVNGFAAWADQFTAGRSIPKLFDDGAKPVIRSCKRQIRNAEENFFMFVNFLDAHHHYQHVLGYDRDVHDVPFSWVSTLEDEHTILFQRSTDGYEEYVENRRQLYAAAVEYLDRKVTPFVEWVLSETDEETTVVITADHGDNLGSPADESLVHHKASVSEGLMHVPLVVVNPPPGYDDRITEYASHLRLRELMAGVARGETPDITADRIAAERIGTWEREKFMKRAEMAGFDADEDDWLWVDRAIRCVYEGQRKWEWDSLGNEIEWELDHDRPCWQRRVDGDAEIPEWGPTMFSEPLVEYKRRLTDLDTGGQDLDETTTRRLEELGYL